MVPIFKTPAEYASEPRYKMVELHNIVFLGSRIAPQTYKEYPGGPGTPAGTSHTVAGVAKEFAEELMRAQRRIFQAFAAQARSPAEITQEAFTSWCGITGKLGGYQFRQSGRHKSGIALDIDTPSNPYIVMGEVGNASASSGEGHSVMTDAERNSMFTDAMQVYDHAMQLVENRPVGQAMAANRRATATTAVWNEIAQVSTAVAVYFSIAFYRQRENKVLDGDSTHHANPRLFDDGTEADFLSQFKLYSDFGVLKGASSWSSRRRELYDQIIEDHPKMRLAAIYGSLSRVSSGQQPIGNTPFRANLGTRDPTRGFLAIRKEVAAGLRAPGSRIVWGACDFGTGANGSGDIMHFDIRNLTSPPADDTHPNAGTIYYGP